MRLIFFGKWHELRANMGEQTWTKLKNVQKDLPDSWWLDHYDLNKLYKYIKSKSIKILRSLKCGVKYIKLSTMKWYEQLKDQKRQIVAARPVHRSQLANVGWTWRWSPMVSCLVLRHLARPCQGHREASVRFSEQLDDVRCLLCVCVYKYICKYYVICTYTQYYV